MSKHVAGLSPRQRQVLTGARDGLANKQIAEQLGISRKTVAAMFTDAFDALGVDNRTAAVVQAIKQGLIPLGE